jgi:hypothetical protein
VGSRAIEWVPASADELTERRRIVRTTDLADIGIDTLFLGAATIGMPLLLLFGAPAPLSVRLPGALAFGVVLYLGFMFSRQGLYLSEAGVTVWRTIFPRRLIPWSEIEGFRLVCRKVDLGRREMERVAVVTTGGELVELWPLNRYVDFESRSTPVESEKEKLRTIPELVEQLNRIARARNGSPADIPRS